MTYTEVWKRLAAVYTAEEAKAMARMLLEDGFGLSLADICCGGTERLDDEAAATCQVLYNLGCHLPVQLTPQIANCLYTGIATDTGCFQYQNASASNTQIKH